MKKIAFCDDDISILQELQTLFDQYRADRDEDLGCAMFHRPLELIHSMECGAGFEEMYTAEELTVTADTAFGEVPLFDGSYSMVFEMWDSAGNYAYSDAVTFDCVDGAITSTTIYEN